MNTYDRVKALCEKRGITIKALERNLGIGNGTIAYWKKGSPKTSSLNVVAEYFGVSVDYLLGTVEENSSYYNDVHVARIAQACKDRPELKVLFDASRDLKKEDIEFIISMIERMK